MLPPDSIKCPATGFTRSCRSIVAEHDCPKFVAVRGVDPQTNAVVDRHGCADGFLPLLLIENAQMSRQVGAAIESFRNEVLKGNQEASQAVVDALARFRTPQLVKGT